MAVSESNAASATQALLDFVKGQGGAWVVVGLVLALVLSYFESRNSDLEKELAALKLEQARKEEQLKRAQFEEKLAVKDSMLAAIRMELAEMEKKSSDLKVRSAALKTALDRKVGDVPSSAHSYFDS